MERTTQINGMSTDQMNHEESGQGIGLFMVKKLLDYFSGDIQGSTFRISLPVNVG
ncbi:ATP-binding protein [Tumebacillus sp. ITR2]|uniref:ATP-binding protein n=1 Tax=Tumebacillus amylolyticus TaxID=2801339 RepID=A0ABS1JD72_9BACL|nr:ATP-binding protein [Tumebacillus amylolyticus]MBL0388231.1 ATP-binding protein [Tumebacillus amylolyticus]